MLRYINFGDSDFEYYTNLIENKYIINKEKNERKLH